MSIVNARIIKNTWRNQTLKTSVFSDITSSFPFQTPGGWCSRCPGQWYCPGLWCTSSHTGVSFWWCAVPDPYSPPSIRPGWFVWWYDGHCVGIHESNKQALCNIDDTLDVQVDDMHRVRQVIYFAVQKIVMEITRFFSKSSLKNLIAASICTGVISKIIAPRVSSSSLDMAISLWGFLWGFGV